MGLTDQERPPWHEKTALEIMLAWNSWNSAAQEAFLAFPWLYRPPLDAIPPDPKDAVAVLSPSSPSIGLLNVVNDQHAPVAAATIANGLDRLFHRLGPPPDSLDAHRSGPIDGDGGAAR